MKTLRSKHIVNHFQISNNWDLCKSCLSVMSGWSVLVEAFLGLIPRQCPQDPLPEPLTIRNCSSDADCWPRLCCPDGDLRFCRTAAIMWDSLGLPTLRLLTRKCCRWCGNAFTDITVLAIKINYNFIHWILLMFLSKLTENFNANKLYYVI